MYRSKRVLLATNTFGLLGGEVNGVAYTCQNLVAQFQTNGMPVDVLTYGSPERVVELDGRTRIYVHDPVNGMAIDPSLRIDPFFARGAIARAVRENEYALVQTTTPDPLGWFAANLAAAQSIPLVAGYHTMVDTYARIRFGEIHAALGRAAETFLRTLLDWYYRKADLILAPSDAVRDMLRPRFESPVVTLERGVDHKTFSPEHRTRSRFSPPRAIYVGRVAQEKGLDKLLTIFRGWEDVELTIVGDGPYFDTMKRALPTARYTGKLTGEALSREFANGDFFVFPSETDSFGNVVLQAMSSGLPVVVMDQLGAKQSVLPGITGFVAHDAEAFGARCRQLAGDVELRLQMGRAARAHALTYRWDAIFSRLLELYGIARAGWRGEDGERKLDAVA
ncbi:MAG: glycosyltransferase [Acidobacteria bacterium]|nr:glycosyltransferase [Acidobacteriota bacterium]